MLSWIVVPLTFGAALEKVPDKAASRLKGRADALRDAKGGSIRVNGAEVRRALWIADDLRFGERPAGAVKGARGDDMLALAGVERRDGMVGGGGIDVDGASEKVNGL